jgi:TonB family protein
MNYFVEANLGLVFLYGIYFLLLGRETDFGKQRAFLLLSMGCALLFPLITISTATVSPELISTVMLPDFYVGTETNTPSIDILMIVYTAVASIIVVTLLLHAFGMYKTVKSGPGTYRNNYYVIESSDNVPSWSFFRLIYIGRSSGLTNADRELIVKHEMLHGQLYHSADMLFATLLCVVFWFNPIVWLYRRTLAKVHEFQVDGIVAHQDGVAPYTELLVKSALAGNGFLLTHHFNQSFILKRINMITTIKNRISSWKLVVLAMSLGLYFVSVSCSETDQQEEFKQPEPYKGEVLQVVSDPPAPVGGFSAFAEELNSVLKYPKSAKEKGIQGTVYVEFIVRPDGTMSDYKIMKGLGDDCDNAALLAVSKLKNWNPGSHNGKPVAVRFVLPIKFQLD